MTRGLRAAPPLAGTFRWGDPNDDSIDHGTSSKTIKKNIAVSIFTNSLHCIITIIRTAELLIQHGIG
jgi:hypothetical protein